jgi:hypothetical protein
MLEHKDTRKIEIAIPIEFLSQSCKMERYGKNEKYPA